LGRLAFQAVLDSLERDFEFPCLRGSQRLAGG
jgi:hypothetical protein